MRGRVWQRGIVESNVMARVNYRAAGRCERKRGSTFPTAAVGDPRGKGAPAGVSWLPAACTNQIRT